MAACKPLREHTLEEWTKFCFERLPCYDRTSYGARGTIYLNEPVDGRRNDRRMQPRIENINVATGVPFEELADELRGFARANERMMMDEKHWLHSSMAHETRVFNATAVLQRSGVFDLDVDESTRRQAPPGHWGAQTSKQLASAGAGAQFPFVARLLLPEDAVVAVFGDLHGSVHSLLRELGALREKGYLDSDWRVVEEWKDRFFVLFLGDYVDRGMHGVETLYTVARLVRSNPENVFAARGNHEDAVLNRPEYRGKFQVELLNKYGNDLGKRAGVLTERVYDLLPAALFLGTRPLKAGESLDAATSWKLTQSEVSLPRLLPGAFVLACHGGLEVGYDAEPLLQAESTSRVLYAPILSLLRRTWWRSSPADLQNRVPDGLARDLFRDYASVDAGMGGLGSPLGDAFGVKAAAAGADGPWPLPPMGPQPGLGFLWSDFAVDDATWTVKLQRGRGPVHGLPFTAFWLRRSGVAAVLRAHQHNDAPAAGPMLSRMREGNGVASSWGERAGLVFTFLSATECPEMQFYSDSFGLLHLDGARPRDWRLLHCSHPVGEQVLWDARANAWTSIDDDWARLVRSHGGLGGNSTLSPPTQTATDHPHLPSSLEQSASPRRRELWSTYAPSVEHACDITDSFVCRPLSWAGHPARTPKTLRRALAAMLHSAFPTSPSPPQQKNNTSFELEPVHPLPGSVIRSDANRAAVSSQGSQDPAGTSVNLVFRATPSSQSSTSQQSQQACTSVFRVRDAAIRHALDPTGDTTLSGPYIGAAKHPEQLGRALARSSGFLSIQEPHQLSQDEIKWERAAAHRNAVTQIGSTVCSPLQPEQDGNYTFTIALSSLAHGEFAVRAEIGDTQAFSTFSVQ